MELSLSQAADILGRSPRQLRYMIKNGTLTATKRGARWVVQSEDLPLTGRQRDALATRAKTARDAVNTATEPALGTAATAKPEPKKAYSVRDLDAFRIGREIARELAGAESDAAGLMYESVEWLTRGVHCFHAPHKVARFLEAREAAAKVVTMLLVHGDEADPHAARLETELLPRISKLIAGHERRDSTERGGRFRRRSRA